MRPFLVPQIIRISQPAAVVTFAIQYVFGQTLRTPPCVAGFFFPSVLRPRGIGFCLFCAFPHQLSLPAARRSRVGVLHFVTRDRYGSLLIGPVPIRKRAAFDVQVKSMIRLIDGVGAKVRNGALYHRLIFIRRAFKTVVARESA